MTTMKWHQKLRKMCHAFCGWRDSDAIDYNADDPEDEDAYEVQDPALHTMMKIRWWENEVEAYDAETNEIAPDDLGEDVISTKTTTSFRDGDSETSRNKKVSYWQLSYFRYHIVRALFRGQLPSSRELFCFSRSYLSCILYQWKSRATRKLAAGCTCVRQGETLTRGLNLIEEMVVVRSSQIILINRSCFLCPLVVSKTLSILEKRNLCQRNIFL